MQLIVFIIKRVIMSICMLYTFDLIVMSAGIVIPINFFSIGIVSFLGLPAIFGFLVLQNYII